MGGHSGVPGVLPAGDICGQFYLHWPGLVLCLRDPGLRHHDPCRHDGDDVLLEHQSECSVTRQPCDGNT